MTIFLLIEDYGGGVAVYAYSTRARAEAAETALDAACTGEDPPSTTWIVEAVLDAAWLPTPEWKTKP